MSNPNPPVNKNHPDRAVVERIARQEAEAAEVRVSLVTGMSKSSLAWRARQRAMSRIVRETGCSVLGLAEVWGCHPNSVTEALKAAPPWPLTYEAQAPGFRVTGVPLSTAWAATFDAIDRMRGRR